MSEDPVKRLKQSAKTPESSEEFRVTGVAMQYYEICERELWFHSRGIEIDRSNPDVVRGSLVDQNAYAERRRSMMIDGTISVDLLEDGRVIEVKPSSAITKGARMQLLYYLWYLKHIHGIEREGVLAHPTERSREAVSLTDDTEQRVEEAIRGVHDIVTADEPPPAEEKPYCESCAYHDFCWSC